MEGDERSESSAGSESDTRSDAASDSEHEWSPQTSVLVSLPAPTIDTAKQALADIKHILKPPQDSGPGHKDPGLDLLLRSRLEKMRMFLRFFINHKDGLGWTAASKKAVEAFERGEWRFGSGRAISLQITRVS
ncbi:hypothetical protein BOTBODRAFT_28021 [Botryobasidium botryosum FD-172 SS1]|uniref:Uncharacterized protein n=1 Tax=Botryobasidium botryosum (strain FD-172 SS1) TaxID=930990 RepID=A0A067MUM2_BOTB1|nr:hypothetical protein BOTBODRAFT_28021 [Botryobasidium botryosum FD-172 SS1]